MGYSPQRSAEVLNADCGVAEPSELIFVDEILNVYYGIPRLTGVLFYRFDTISLPAREQGSDLVGLSRAFREGKKSNLAEPCQACGDLGGGRIGIDQG
jgi:hypothetical protein